MLEKYKSYPRKGGGEKLKIKLTKFTNFCGTAHKLSIRNTFIVKLPRKTIRSTMRHVTEMRTLHYTMVLYLLSDDTVGPLTGSVL